MYVCLSVSRITQEVVDQSDEIFWNGADGD